MGKQANLDLKELQLLLALVNHKLKYYFHGFPPGPYEKDLKDKIENEIERIKKTNENNTT